MRIRDPYGYSPEPQWKKTIPFNHDDPEEWTCDYGTIKAQAVAKQWPRSVYEPIVTYIQWIVESYVPPLDNFIASGRCRTIHEAMKSAEWMVRCFEDREKQIELTESVIRFSEKWASEGAGK